jgi:hypothetical protein
MSILIAKSIIIGTIVKFLVMVKHLLRVNLEKLLQALINTDNYLSINIY